MVYHGTVRNGVIVLDQPAPQFEGRRVAVDLISDDTVTDAALASPHGQPTIWQKLAKLSGTVESSQTDASVNHDHYLYGAPKRDDAK